MSEIRQLLASAQHAEIQGDVREAIRWLRQAEAWYLERRQGPRAEQMRRNIDRLGARDPAVGLEGEAFGFGDELERSGEGARLAAPLRPGAGPAVPTPPALLPEQARVLAALTRRAVQLALLVGPEGSGKSTILAHLGRPTPAPPASPPADRVLLEPDGALGDVEVERVLAWLDAGTPVVLAVRGAAPPPALLLPSAAGPVPVHATEALRMALPHVHPRLLGRVELVVEVALPSAEEMRALARARLEARGAQLPEAAVQRLVELALASPRGAHELVILVARIPPGRYGAEAP